MNQLFVILLFLLTLAFQVEAQQISLIFDTSEPYEIELDATVKGVFRIVTERGEVVRDWQNLARQEFAVLSRQCVEGLRKKGISLPRDIDESIFRGSNWGKSYQELVEFLGQNEGFNLSGQEGERFVPEERAWRKTVYGHLVPLGVREIQDLQNVPQNRRLEKAEELLRSGMLSCWAMAFSVDDNGNVQPYASENLGPEAMRSLQDISSLLRVTLQDERLNNQLISYRSRLLTQWKSQEARHYLESLGLSLPNRNVAGQSLSNSISSATQ